MSQTSSLLQVSSPTTEAIFQRMQRLTEKEEFYENFLNYREISEISISGYRIKKDRFQEFAVYQIIVQTMDLTYEIEKRYSEFHAFYQTIMLNYPKIVLPEFPKKRFFRNLSEKCLEERKKKLEDFLGQVLESHKEFKMFEFFDFINLHNKYKKSHEIFNLVSNLKNCKKNASTKDDAVLLELLIQLNISPQNRLQNFQKINDFLFEKKPKISTKVVEILIKGENKLLGLVQILGCSHSENHLVCSIGFKLFCALFDHEYNKAAEFFIDIFTKISLEEFKCMKLEEHILEKPAKNCKQYALKILETYASANQNIFKEVSNEINQEFLKYKNKRSMVCQKVERNDKRNDFFVGSIQNSVENGIKSALVKQDSYFSKLLLFNNNMEKISSSD